MLWIIIAIIAAALFLYIGFRIYTDHRRKEQEQAMALQREHDAARYHNALVRQLEQRSILVHDIQRHLETLLALNEEGKHSEAAEYLKQLLSAEGFARSVRVCDHELLNGILARYRDECRQQQIDLEMDIRSGTISFLEDPDVTALFSNLLDNAVSAAKKTADPQIRLFVDKEETETVIRMENSCTEDDARYLEERTSPKKDGIHGYGLKSIEDIAKKYHGDMLVFVGKDRNTCHTVVTLMPMDPLVPRDV